MLRSKFLRVLLCVIGFIFIFNQVYSSVYNPLKTETASYIEQTDGISATGIVIRNEEVIERAQNGVMHFNLNDGERAAKGGVIADIYTNENDSVAALRIDEIKQQIENIKTIQSYNDLAAIDINLLNSKIGASLTKILYSAGQGDFTSVSENKQELLTMLNRKDMVVGTAVDFSAQLNALEIELASLSASLGNPISSVLAESSGFFVSAVDGYESVLTTDDFSVYTADMLNNLKAEDTKDNQTVGKIVSDYTWYIAVSLPFDDAVKFQEGDSVSIKTNLKTNPKLKVKVHTVNSSLEEKNAVIVFSCQEMNSTLAAVRTLPLTIIEGDYEGLKVTRSAIRVVENKTGVFVVSGMELKFVKVNVLYMDDDYVICEKASTNDTSVLRLYDKIVVKGKNLYDGKIIN